MRPHHDHDEPLVRRLTVVGLWLLVINGLIGALTRGQHSQYLDDPAALERELAGLTILSSAYGDTLGDQGLCRVHQVLLTPGLSCPRFELRPPAGAALDAPEEAADWCGG